MRDDKFRLTQFQTKTTKWFFAKEKYRNFKPKPRCYDIFERAVIKVGFFLIKFFAITSGFKVPKMRKPFLAKNFPKNWTAIDKFWNNSIDSNFDQTP